MILNRADRLSGTCRFGLPNADGFFKCFVNPKAISGLIGVLVLVAGCSGSQDSSSGGAGPAKQAAPPAAVSSEFAVNSERFVVTSVEETNGRITQGHVLVPENRTSRSGLQLQLQVTILHAREAQPEPDPVFVLAGGPGVDANIMRGGYENSSFRLRRDIVLVSQRGTAANHRLEMQVDDGIENTTQSLLEPFITAEQARRLAARLGRKYDLTQYSTCQAMDDLNEVRQILGYDKINLVGGSYGTRAALVYLRQHGATVRAAILEGVAPIEFINPLYHAQEAQRALDLIFAEVEQSDQYQQAFPQLRQRFGGLLAELDAAPKTIEYQGESIVMTRESFAAALRFQLYSLDTSRQVPFLLQRAAEGDFQPFLDNVIRRNRGLQSAIALGMLLCVTAAEDIDRIDPAVVAEVTRGTFLGDSRIRQQQSACAEWPRSKLPDGYGEPVSSDVPTLILSGTIDPVTSPRWGDLIEQRFPNSKHVVLPGAHGLNGACVDSIRQQFMDAGSVEKLDLSCCEQVALPPLRLK